MTPTDPLSTDERRIADMAMALAVAPPGTVRTLELDLESTRIVADAFAELHRRRQPLVALKAIARAFPPAPDDDAGPDPTIASLREQALGELRTMGGTRKALSGDVFHDPDEDPLDYAQRLATLAAALKPLADAERADEDRTDELGDALAELIAAVDVVANGILAASEAGLKSEHLTEGVFAPLWRPIDGLCTTALPEARAALDRNPHRS